MIDKFTPVKGILEIQCLDEHGNITDVYKQNNMIMNSARITMAELIAGLSTSTRVNKFVLGTEGHVNGDYLTAKTFDSSRTELFSEESSGFTYPITFTTPGTALGDCTITSEPDSGTTISIKHINDSVEKSVEYTIEIVDAAANNTGEVIYTEAALYAGTNIFSMKTFGGKIKNNTVSLRIIWKLLF